MPYWCLLRTVAVRGQEGCCGEGLVGLCAAVLSEHGLGTTSAVLLLPGCSHLPILLGCEPCWLISSHAVIPSCALRSSLSSTFGHAAATAPLMLDKPTQLQQERYYCSSALLRTILAVLPSSDIQSTSFVTRFEPSTLEPAASTAWARHSRDTVCLLQQSLPAKTYTPCTYTMQQHTTPHHTKHMLCVTQCLLPGRMQPLHSP